MSNSTQDANPPGIGAKDCAFVHQLQLELER